VDSFYKGILKEFLSGGKRNLPFCLFEGILLLNPILNPKSKISNSKQIQSANPQNSKHA